MRKILVGEARRRRRLKRGGKDFRVSLSEVDLTPAGKQPDLIALDDALDALAEFDARKSRIVELRFFGGLSVAETASNRAHINTLELGSKEGSISAFSPDGKLLAAATTDGTVSVWAVPTWKQQVSFKAFAEVVTAIVFAPDSKQLLTGGRENVIKVWEPPSGQQLRTIPCGTSVVGRAMAFLAGAVCV